MKLQLLILCASMLLSSQAIAEPITLLCRGVYSNWLQNPPIIEAEMNVTLRLNVENKTARVSGLPGVEEYRISREFEHGFGLKAAGNVEGWLNRYTGKLTAQHWKERRPDGGGTMFWFFESTCNRAQRLF